MKKFPLLSRVLGFTLIEVVLSVAMMGVLGGVTLVIFQSYQSSNDLDVTSSALAQIMRRAQVLSTTSQGESPWGVHVGDQGITLFRGESYATRDTEYDEIYTVPETIAIESTPIITGTCETGARVVVTVQDTTETITTTCRSGAFHVTPLQSFALTGNGATATQTDIAGNISSVGSISW